MQEKQASIVAFYGSKPTALGSLIENIQAELAARIGSAFIPRDIAQVHATVIGLEGIRHADIVYNSNFALARNSQRAMDLPGLLDELLHDARLPMEMQFGGYGAAVASPIVSRGKTPYWRSFGFQADLAVMIGWPVDASSRPLHELRKSCQRRNVLHKYHARDTDVDDDLFLVIGSLRADGRPIDQDLQTVETALRQLLADLAPVRVQLDASALSVVQYEDSQLPPQSTVHWNLDDARSRLATILSCYPAGGS